MELKLATGRRSIVIERGDESRNFAYDIVEQKLLAEELEIKHGMRREDTEKVGAPTIAFLREYANILDHLGMSGCTIDAAFRFYNLVGTQFLIMSAELELQIREIVKN